MYGLHIALLSATLSCALVAGFLFAFSCVVMPGIGTLDAREFLRSFQVVDRVIQNNQPLFMLVWMGSVLTLTLSTVLGFSRLAGDDLALLLIAAILYIVGVQVPTGAINVPLNNHLQTLDLETIGDEQVVEARATFEPRWNRWNRIRTVASVLTALLLVLVVWRL